MKTIFSLILIVAAVAGFFLYTDKQYKAAKVLQAKVDKYDEGLNQAKDLIAQRDAVAKVYSEITEPDKEKLKKMVPDSIDNIRLVIDMVALANSVDQQNLKVKSIKVAGGTGGAGAAAAAASAAAAKPAILGPDTSGYGTISLSFSVTAPYNTFKDFLRAMESSLRIVDVTNISFVSNDKGQYDYNVVMKTYWLRR